MTGHTWEHLQPVTPTSDSLQELPGVTVTLHRVSTHIMDLLHGDVGFCGQPQVLWLHINDHQHLGEKESERKTGFWSWSKKKIPKPSSSLLSTSTRLLRSVSSGTGTMIQKFLIPVPQSLYSCVTSKKGRGQGFPDAPFREREKNNPTSPRWPHLQSWGSISSSVH